MARFEVSGIPVNRSDYYAAQPYFSQIQQEMQQIATFTYAGKTVNNPYTLSPQECEYVALYISGYRASGFYASRNARVEAAYAKYQQAKEWYSSMQTNQSQLEYESAGNQLEQTVEGLENVGINPDLYLTGGGDPVLSGAGNGGQTQVGSAADALGASVAESSGVDVTNAMSIFNAGLSLLSGISSVALQAAQVASSMSATRFTNTQNALMQLGYSSQFLNNTVPDILNTYGSELFESGSMAGFNKLLTNDKLAAVGLDSKGMDLARRFFNTRFESPAAVKRYYESVKQAEADRQAYYSLLHSPIRYGVEGFAEANELKYSTEIQILRAQKAKAAYDEAYNNILNPETQATQANTQAEFDTAVTEATNPVEAGAAVNWTNRAIAAQKEMDICASNIYKEYFTRLKARAQRGSFDATLAAFQLSVLTGNMSSVWGVGSFWVSQVPGLISGWINGTITLDEFKEGLKSLRIQDIQEQLDNINPDAEGSFAESIDVLEPFGLNSEDVQYIIDCMKVIELLRP